MSGLRILDVGSGLSPKLVSAYTEIEAVACDLRQNAGIDHQNMEKLTYPDNSFDVVICINALDHTKDAEAAVKQMLSVSQGLVYINCAIDQKTRHRKKHYWDAKPDGVFTNGTDSFDLKDYDFEIEFEGGRMIAKCFQ